MKADHPKASENLGVWMFFFMGISVKASGPSMMGQKVAAEVAKAQLLHSKGGALSKTTTCVSWINQHYPEKKNWIQHNTTNSHQALVRTFLPTTTSERPSSRDIFRFINLRLPTIKVISQNAFQTQGLPITWGSPWIYGRKRQKTIKPKVEQSLRDLLLIFETNAQEHRWAPMSTHEFKYVVLLNLSRPMQLENYMFKHCFHNFWFGIFVFGRACF